LSDFIEGLRAKGSTSKHVSQTDNQAKGVLQLSGIENVGDLLPHKVQGAIGAIRAGGASPATCNHCLLSVKSFSRWLMANGRVAVDSIQHLKADNVDVDRRRIRRVLADAEIAQLIPTAETGPTILGMPGPVRAMLYRTALGTGFRASELGSLTPESFDLDGSPPTITVRAAHSKHRREDVQPVRRDLADMLRGWLAFKPGGVPVFDMPHKPATMIRRDLEAARDAWLRQGGDPDSDFLSYVDHAGNVANFHSLRHTSVTQLANGGASIKTCQTLARHSNQSLAFTLIPGCTT